MTNIEGIVFEPGNNSRKNSRRRWGWPCLLLAFWRQWMFSEWVGQSGSAEEYYWPIQVEMLVQVEMGLDECAYKGWQAAISGQSCERFLWPGYNTPLILLPQEIGWPSLTPKAEADSPTDVLWELHWCGPPIGSTDAPADGFCWFGSPLQPHSKLQPLITYQLSHTFSWVYFQKSITPLHLWHSWNFLSVSI